MSSDYTISRVVQLKAIVLYCRRNARFPVHTCPPRKFSECAARFLIRPGLLDEFDLPSRQEEACEKLEAVHERAFSIIVELSMKYSRQGDRKNRNKTFQKIEQLHQEFTEAQNRALEYLDNRKDDRSSVSTESPKSIRFTGTGKPAHVVRQENFQTSHPLWKIDDMLPQWQYSWQKTSEDHSEHLGSKPKGAYESDI